MDAPTKLAIATTACAVQLLAASLALAHPVDTLLEGVDSAPTAEQWRRAGPTAGARLREIARDEAVPLSRRARAVVGLRHFPSRATRLLLVEMLASAEAPSVLRRKSALTLAAAYGAESVGELAIFAGDDDPALRADVAVALARLGTPAALQVLRDRLGRETTWVRGTLERALGGSR